MEICTDSQYRGNLLRQSKIFFSLPLILTLLLASSSWVEADDHGQIKAGFAAIDITPYQFETAPVHPSNPFYKFGQPFYDTGVDGLYDFEEPGAFGPDGKPGIAGYDDGHDGMIDNCTREKCDEYLAEFSDDVPDPARDNFDPFTNPLGTEGDHRFNFINLGGFNPFYPVPFIGNRLAQGVHDPVWARAIAIEGSNGVRTVLISADLPGLVWKHINPVRRQIEKVYGIPVSNIVIASTHDHAAPDAAGYWSTALPGHGKAYTDRLRVWLFNAAAAAIRAMEPAKMKTIATRHIACYNSKTREWKKDPDCNIPMNSTDYNLPGGDRYDEEAIQADKRNPKVRNTEITAAQFISVATGQTLGTFINWHAHPDSLGSSNMLISSEFVHYLREFAEKKLGGVAVYFTGTLGCQIGQAWYVPLWSEDMKPVFASDPDSHGKPTRAVAPQDDWVKIRSEGYEVANEVVSALNSKSGFSAQTEVSARTEPLDIAPVNILHLVTTKSVWNFDVEPEDSMISYPGRCMGRFGCVRSDVSLMQIGDLSILTAPGEIDPAYWVGRPESVAHYGGKWGDETYPAMAGARPLLKGPYKAVLGQANNYLSYLLPRSDNVGALKFKHPNHYEEFVTVNKHFGDDTGNKWMQMLGSRYRYNKRKILPKKY